MLRYLNGGSRHFGRHPIAPHTRLNWEFYAVLKGSCGVLLDSGKQPIQTKRLWIFPPQHLHGWHGGLRACEVAVFHFGAVSPALEEALADREYLECELNDAARDQIAALGRSLRADFARPTICSELRFQRGLIDLTLIALASRGDPEVITLERRVLNKVDAAIEWFRQHLRDKPSVEDVARAAHVSTSHLRRLFLAAGRGSPHDALNKVRLESAMRLMRESDLKLESIATEVGFASASDFSRAFKVHAGATPREWRMAILPPYNHEAGPANPPHRVEPKMADNGNL